MQQAAPAGSLPRVHFDLLFVLSGSILRQARWWNLIVRDRTQAAQGHNSTKASDGGRRRTGMRLQLEVTEVGHDERIMGGLSARSLQLELDSTRVGRFRAARCHIDAAALQQQRLELDLDAHAALIPVRQQDVVGVHRRRDDLHAVKSN